MISVTPLHYRPVQKVALTRFGSSNSLFNALGDFKELGKTAVRNNQIIYAGVILSRMLFSRSANEAWENARRDVLGWYFWFMGSPLMQTALVLGLVPAISKASKGLMVTPMNQNASLGQKILWTLSSPSKLWTIASDKQLHQRKAHVLDAMKNEALAKSGGTTLDKAALARMANAGKLFEKTTNLRALVSFVGLAFTFFALGIGINLLNIAMTKAALNKKQKPSSPAGNPFAASPGMMPMSIASSAVPNPWMP